MPMQGHPPAPCHVVPALAAVMVGVRISFVVTPFFRNFAVEQYHHSMNKYTQFALLSASTLRMLPHILWYLRLCRIHLEHSYATYLNADRIGRDFYCLHLVTLGNGRAGQQGVLRAVCLNYISRLCLSPASGRWGRAFFSLCAGQQCRMAKSKCDERKSKRI